MLSKRSHQSARQRHALVIKMRLGSKSEANSIAKDGAKMVMRVSCARNASFQFSQDSTGGSDIFTNCAQFNLMTTIQQETLNVEIFSTEVNNPIFLARNLPSNKEAILSQSEDGGDYDIPNFIVVEAVILDEDSGLDEQHLYMSRTGSSELLQTFKYENAETQKRIMRLEQAADAFVKREMKSHGAFAILQGRHMNYYVKKLRTIIHMDHEGSFHMKKLSKYSIFINNMELATNQSVILTSGYLIEIKETAFLFEVNEAHIKECHSTKNITDMTDNSTRESATF